MFSCQIPYNRIFPYFTCTCPYCQDTLYSSSCSQALSPQWSRAHIGGFHCRPASQQLRMIDGVRVDNSIGIYNKGSHMYCFVESANHEFQWPLTWITMKKFRQRTQKLHSLWDRMPACPVPSQTKSLENQPEHSDHCSVWQRPQKDIVCWVYSWCTYLPSIHNWSLNKWIYTLYWLCMDLFCTDMIWYIYIYDICMYEPITGCKFGQISAQLDYFLQSVRFHTWHPCCTKKHHVGLAKLHHDH